MEVHEPYSRNEGNMDKNFIMNIRTNKLDPNLVQKWRENYPREVSYVSKRLMDIMKLLKERGIFDNSLIPVTSDHGQLLGEHGRISHGTFLYDELLRVPLLIKYPQEYNIELTNQTSKYISLTRLRQFILDVIDNKIKDDKILYETTIFSESYGVHQNVGKLTNEKERKNVEQLEKYRIASYHDNFKGIFNVEDWKFESIISCNPDIEITEDIIKRMKKSVLKFLKMSTAPKLSRIEL